MAPIDETTGATRLTSKTDLLNNVGRELDQAKKEYETRYETARKLTGEYVQRAKTLYGGRVQIISPIDKDRALYFLVMVKGRYEKDYPFVIGGDAEKFYTPIARITIDSSPSKLVAVAPTGEVYVLTSSSPAVRDSTYSFYSVETRSLAGGTGNKSYVLSDSLRGIKDIDNIHQFKVEGGYPLEIGNGLAVQFGCTKLQQAFPIDKSIATRDTVEEADRYLQDARNMLGDQRTMVEQLSRQLSNHPVLADGTPVA